MGQVQDFPSPYQVAMYKSEIQAKYKPCYTISSIQDNLEFVQSKRKEWNSAPHTEARKTMLMWLDEQEELFEDAHEKLHKEAYPWSGEAESSRASKNLLITCGYYTAILAFVAGVYRISKRK